MLERNKQHQRDALASREALKSKTTHIRDHTIREHRGEVDEIQGNFRMDLGKSSSTALERQVREALDCGDQEDTPEELCICLLPTMVMESPKLIKEQELEDQEEEIFTLTP